MDYDDATNRLCERAALTLLKFVVATANNVITMH